MRLKSKFEHGQNKETFYKWHAIIVGLVASVVSRHEDERPCCLNGCIPLNFAIVQIEKIKM